LHQGTHLVPVDLIGGARPSDDLPTPDGTGTMHDLLMANLFAQSRVLAFGRTEEEVRAEDVARAVARHKAVPGDRPSTTTLAAALGLNAFDQWGVELGKSQAGELLPVLTAEKHPEQAFDSSTASLIEIYREARGRR